MNHTQFQKGLCLPEFRSLHSMQEQRKEALEKTLWPKWYKRSCVRVTTCYMLHVRVPKNLPGRMSNTQTLLIAGTLFHSPSDNMVSRHQYGQPVQ